MQAGLGEDVRAGWMRACVSKEGKTAGKAANVTSDRSLWGRTDDGTEAGCRETTEEGGMEAGLGLRVACVSVLAPKSRRCRAARYMPTGPQSLAAGQPARPQAGRGTRPFFFF